MVENFGDLEDGDVVTVSLKGRFKVIHETIEGKTGDVSWSGSWVKLDSLDGQEDWSFENADGAGWDISVIEKGSSTQ